MPSEVKLAELNCLACGAVLKSDFTFCPKCGEFLTPHEDAAGQDGSLDLVEFVESSNQNLSDVGTHAAESAFGLGCYIGFIPVVLLVILVFALGVRNWIVIALVALVAVLVTAGIAALLSHRARHGSIEATYHRTVEPEIESYLGARALTRSEFDSTARHVLTADAPLLEYVSSLPERDRDKGKE